MHTIYLTKLVRDAIEPQAVPANPFSDTDDVGENVGVQEMTEGSPAVTTPCAINADSIRCFYPRRGNRPGTRLTFNDGGGFVVTEEFETVKGIVNPN